MARLKLCNEVSINDQETAKYHDQGYLVVENVMSGFECKMLRRLAESFADAERSVVLNIHTKSEVFAQVMKDPTIVNLVKKVQETDITGLNSQYLFKMGGSSYGKQSWTPHQDNSYPKARKGTYIIAHLSLEDSDPGNGGLIFWPGSQEEDILPFENNKSWKENFDAKGISHPGQTVTVPEKYIKTDMYLPKGSLCLMNGNLIHGSYPNLSPFRSRPQYSMAYLNKGEPFERGNTATREPFYLDD